MVEDKLKALSADEIEKTIEEILSCSKVYRNKEIDRVFLFKQPSLKLRRKAWLLYDRFYEEAHQAGLLTIEDMEKVLEQRKIFTELDRRMIGDLDRKIFAQREVLKRTFRVPANRKRLLDIISNLNEEKQKIENKRMEHLRHTCESKASERRTIFMLISCVCDFENEHSIWQNVEDFENWKISMNVKTDLIIEFMSFMNGSDVHIIRQIARSGFWRVRYAMAKNASVNLFDRPVVEFSPDQINLMYWTEFYNSIYEMMPEDRPSDEVIDDDASLDAYMEEYLAERNRDIMSAKSTKGMGSRQSAFSHNQVIVARSNPMYQDIEYTAIPDSVKKRSGVTMNEREEQVKKSNKKVGSTPDRY